MFKLLLFAIVSLVLTVDLFSQDLSDLEGEWLSPLFEEPEPSEQIDLFLDDYPPGSFDSCQLRRWRIRSGGEMQASILDLCGSTPIEASDYRTAKIQIKEKQAALYLAVFSDHREIICYQITDYQVWLNPETGKEEKHLTLVALRSHPTYNLVGL